MEEKDIAGLTHDELMAKTHEDLVAIILNYQDCNSLCSSLLRKELDECEAELTRTQEELAATKTTLDNTELELEKKRVDAETYYKWWKDLQSRYDNCLSALLSLVK